MLFLANLVTNDSGNKAADAVPLPSLPPPRRTFPFPPASLTPVRHVAEIDALMMQMSVDEFSVILINSVDPGRQGGRKPIGILSGTRSE